MGENGSDVGSLAGRSDVGSLAGRAVRLRFVMAAADLYAIQFRAYSTMLTAYGSAES